MLVPTALFDMPPQTPIYLYETGVLLFCNTPFCMCGMTAYFLSSARSFSSACFSMRET